MEELPLDQIDSSDDPGIIPLEQAMDVEPFHEANTKDFGFQVIIKVASESESPAASKGKVTRLLLTLRLIDSSRAFHEHFVGDRSGDRSSPSAGRPRP